MRLHTMIFAILVSTLSFHVTANATLIISSVTISSPSGSEFDTLTKPGGTSDPIRKEIFERMIASTETFSFVDVAHAGEHFLVRVETIKAIMKMGSQGANGINFDYGSAREWNPFTEDWLLGTGWSFPNSFEKIPGAAKAYYFWAKADVPPSIAVLDLETGVTRAECTTAIEAAMHIAHLVTYGGSWMDANAGRVRCNESFYWGRRAADAVVIPGDRVRMTTPSTYVARVRRKNRWRRRNNKAVIKTAYYTGENAVYLGGDKYTGLGGRFRNVDEPAMREQLRQGFNSDTGDNMTKAEAATQIHFQDAKHLRIVISPKAGTP